MHVQRGLWSRLLSCGKDILKSGIDLSKHVRAVSARHGVELDPEQLLRTLDLASVMARDFDGTIRFWSKGCERLYGWTAGEAVGRITHELLQTVWPVPLAEIEAALLRDGEWSGDLIHRRRDGTRITVAVRKVLRRDAEGRPAAVMESVSDATAPRDAQEQLRRLNADLEGQVREQVQAREAIRPRLAQAQRLQALGQLAGGIAHDFNNILQAVAGAASMIERLTHQERIRQLARTTLDAAERGASITARLLAFSRQSELRTEAVAPASVLESLREVLAHTLGSMIEVTVTASSDLPPLLADRGQLETALVNLATNARDAMPAGGRLILSAEGGVVEEGASHSAGLTPGRYVCISVSDTGEGMSAATLARAGEPFFTTKPPGKGTGLGLAMVRGFVEQSGGGLEIDSHLGRGSTVKLWLPQAAASVVEAEPAPETAQNVSGDRSIRHVLLVDDDQLVREMLAMHLEENNYIVRMAASGDEALALLDAGLAVDVLVTDLSMPGINGVTTIREAHRRRPGLAAVLLTGYAGDRAALEAEDGSYLLLRKPIRANHLIKQIETANGPSRAA